MTSAFSAAGLLSGGLFWKKAKNNIPGQIVGANHKRGHQLRDKRFSLPDQTLRKKIAIVGGGIAGLSAAWKLQKNGIDDFIILEMENDVGGNSAYGSNSVSAYPWGAHYIPLPGPEAHDVRELFEELKIIEGYDSKGLPKYNETYICSAPEERLFILGQWQEGIIPNVGLSEKDKEQYKTFFQAMANYKNKVGKDGRRGFVIPLDLSSNDSSFLELDTYSMEEFMRKNGWDSTPLNWYVNYCCRDDYGCEMKDVSAWAGVHYFASRLMRSTDHEEYEVLTWPEGNGWLAKQLKNKLVDHIQPSTMTFSIQSVGKMTQIDAFDFSNNKSLRIECDHAIFAAPRFTAPYVIQNFTEKSEGLSYAPWMVANLTLKHSPGGLGTDLSWDNVIYDNRSLGYVNANHQSLSRFSGKIVATYYLPLSANDPTVERKAALARNHGDWASMAIEDLSYAHKNIRDNIENLDVWVWGHAMVRPTPNLIWSQRKKWGSRSGNIHFAHSDMSGISIFEEAQHQGITAAHNIMTSLNHRFKKS